MNAMRYQESRRSRGIENAWLRLRLWLQPAALRAGLRLADLSHLSDHERRDIGLPEPARYMDWRSLREGRLF
ncbi:hypothetical protein [Microvirga arsenatis]|uniref:DUF1127 domain-containing protein n=1 Tax=Microvirga arsenatis TaxID=2692265 RepID=A0ABW9Z0G4_9HYPH|nr:hypothetical protein [Microvirga arsenatis]NBJ12084.1 hypothetical protein [Microvirga arsenatis]NBJ25925.1 hypothetical protein [Microvirga arsenatis]